MLYLRIIASFAYNTICYHVSLSCFSCLEHGNVDQGDAALSGVNNNVCQATSESICLVEEGDVCQVEAMPKEIESNIFQGNAMAQSRGETSLKDVYKSAYFVITVKDNFLKSNRVTL